MSMVVHDFDVRGTVASLWPHEANAPLIIYSDGMLALSDAHQCLQMISRKVQVAKNECRVELVKFPLRLATKARKRLYTLPRVKVLGAFSFKGLDHRV
jgi:hypothetical protein